MNRTIRSTLIVYILSFGLIADALAQTVVTGKVTDADGEPLIGATVVERGTQNGVTTDLDGNYRLSVSPDATLQFKYLGFITVTRKVGTQTVINVVLEQDTEELDEVVVTALGFKKDGDEIGYANSQVKDKTIVQAAEPTLLNSLSGKATGLTIRRNSGDPGAGAYIQIRGASTFSGDGQPLIVVDGVPINNDNRGTSQIAQQSRLNDINPNDIESVSVLKGAPAAALWGTSALNGAIVITTKSGKYNQKLKVSLRSTYSIDKINRRYPLQDKFGQGNNGVFNPTARDSWGDKIADRSGEADVFDTSGEFFVDQDGRVYYPITAKNSQQTFIDENFDQVFQTGHFFENALSMTAGNETGNIYFSLSNLNQEGIIANNSDYSRTTARINAEQLLNEKFTLNVRSAYTKTNSNRIRRGAQSSGLYLGLLRTPPDFENAGYRGSYFSGPDAAPIENRHRSYRRYLGSSPNPVYNHPLWTTNEQEDIADVDRFINNFKLTYAPLDWMEVIARVGLDTYAEEKTQFFTPGSASGAFRTGLFERELRRSSILNADLIMRATRSISSDFNASVLVGFNYNQSKATTSANEIVNFIQFADVASGTRDINNAAPENRTAVSTTGETRKAAIYTEVSFDAWDMLFLTGTLRSEAASTFGSDADPTFLFPSVSAAWQYHELLDFEALSFAKFRASYGEVGQEPGRYATNNRIVQPSYSDEWGGDLNVGLYGNGGFTPSVELGNPSLRPERKKEFEVGMDLRFFNDRLSFSGTYYNNRTEDLLLPVPIANTQGFDRTLANGANIENKGVEIDLGYTIVNTGDLTVDVKTLYTRNRNMVTDLFDVESINIGGLAAVNSRVIEGQPLGVLFGSRTLRDESGNIVFDANGFPQQDEEEGVIGDPNPDWQGSFITNIRYKNFGLSLLFETFQGADIYAGTKSVLYNLGTWGASGIETTTSQNLLDYNGNVVPAGSTFRGVVKDFGAGPVALTEPWYLGDGGFFSGGNDELYIEDGSWTRLREVVLSYRLVNDWLKNKGLESIEISATGRNLILWTEFEGNDPDTNLEGVSAARGIDYFNNPGTKSYVFSVLLNF
ncbi:MAG: SusC/RagA family TonB-linked outer membrane protein [Ekhidna sp.]